MIYPGLHESVSLSKTICIALPLAHHSTAMLGLLFLKYIKLVPTIGPSYWLFPLLHPDPHIAESLSIRSQLKSHLLKEAFLYPISCSPSHYVVLQSTQHIDILVWFFSVFMVYHLYPLSPECKLHDSLALIILVYRQIPVPSTWQVLIKLSS